MRRRHSTPDVPLYRAVRPFGFRIRSLWKGLGMLRLLAALVLIGAIYGSCILAALLSNEDEAIRAGVRKER